MQPRVLLCTAVLLGFWSLSHAAAERAHLTVKGVRLTDNGDNDGFADPHETVNVYVTLRNGSGSDRNGLVVRMASTDATVACIPTPVVSFGSLLAGEAREAAVPLVFRVANVVRTDPFQDLAVTLDFVVSGDDFGTTKHTQSVTLDVDLTVSGGLLSTSYTEGFESAGFGSFTTQSLDAGRESLAASDGHRCQYNDPDFAGSNSYGSTYCFLGAPSAAQNAYDWHVHTTASPDGGRAYLGNNSLHWGVHDGAAGADTTRLRQLDAIRTTNTINLGWNGVASELSFKHQVGLTDCDYISCWHGHNADRGVVQVQLATSAGQAVGNWRKINPYENLYDSQTVNHYANCLFDPVDDGNTEDDYFEPTDPERRLGPSSTCFPEFSFSRQGATSNEVDPYLGYLWPLGRATDGPALVGIRGPGRWVESKFSLDRWRGRRIRLRFLTTSIEAADAVTAQQALGWNPTPADDGWYIDDIQVSNTLTSTATVSVDTADRSGLPACGPVCTSLAASLVAAPARGDCAQAFTLDASGSSADQCPGGALQFRFWWTWSELPPVGVLNEKHGVLLQDWNENGIFSHPAETIGPHPYRVDVRCSTLPACGASATGQVTVDSSCPRIIDFPYTIRFDSPSIISWGIPTYFQAYRGNLDAVRASGGNFAGTQEASGYDEAESSWNVGESVPGPGESKYYLVRGTRTTFQPPHACTLYTWSTGSPAEVPGAGGTRDQDLEEPGTVPCP